MELFHLLTQVVLVEVGIDFGCAHRTVTKHFLNHANIRAALHQMGSKGVPESMGLTCFRMPASCAVLLNMVNTI